MLIEAKRASVPDVVKYLKPRVSALDSFKLYFEEMLPDEKFIIYVQRAHANPHQTALWWRTLNHL